MDAAHRPNDSIRRASVSAARRRLSASLPTSDANAATRSDPTPQGSGDPDKSKSKGKAKRVSPSRKKKLLAAKWAVATSETLTGQSLWTAASEGDLAKVKQCIDAGSVDINYADKYDGTTAVWMAAKDDNVPILRALAEAGADLFAVTKGEDRWSPAEVAAYYGSVGAMKVLYEYGVDVYQDLTGNGQSPHEILWYRFGVSFQELLEEVAGSGGGGGGDADSQQHADADGVDEKLGEIGAKLFQIAMKKPAGFVAEEAAATE